MDKLGRPGERLRGQTGVARVDRLNLVPPRRQLKTRREGVEVLEQSFAAEDQGADTVLPSAQKASQARRSRHTLNGGKKRRIKS